MVTHAEAHDPDIHRFGADADLDARAALIWRFNGGRESLSSAPVGGGWRRIDWLLNIGVLGTYDRTDLDAHATEVAAHLDLTGQGQALLTAADVTMGVAGESGGVRVDATVGITKPTWAADADDTFAHRVDDVWVPGPRGASALPLRRRSNQSGKYGEPATLDLSAQVPGTINIVVQMPVPLTPAAAVNAVITATEAKTQALVEAAIPGTGTASDAVTILWPTQSPGVDSEAFTGPRSPWGARLGRAVHNAVNRGIEVHP